MNDPRFWLVVPAAGIGQRMNAGCPKQYLRIRGRFLLDITLSRLLEHDLFIDCVVPLHSADTWWSDTEASHNARVITCRGGGERIDSVLSALVTIEDRAQAGDWILVHDVARPCVSHDDLTRLVTELVEHPVGGLLAAPVTDTLKVAEMGDQGVDVCGTQDRSRLWRALTPQMFRYGDLKQALEQAVENQCVVTDEASAIEMAGATPRIVEGRPDNIKVTLPADLAMAEFILGQLEACPQAATEERG
ncbi:2-C-methyl-D-erythritol 4-phosphate cytidylyltransferase [Marinobacter zhejiangensis]|uniref:2-C-methyl-D-erythritol 4-phosphate cytidylyltransferase n=1 Tax=Marinobacter zhejiangensis TaxID=488535 RepID=A0A1I4RAK8_9GAMM|nr:2-C-methyl-D-erythritol 4-phosphate cytidylyltransferase [Marinobacter zhejiangensis]SFM49249.1 2-C-methyl-D-erythritol 4-phosphate cytidylyltransferase [Marinobacter zhejiangensis]